MRAPTRLTLCTFLAAAATAASAAADDAESRRAHEKSLEKVVVTAAPLAEPGEELVEPAAVLSGAELEQQRGATLGATVASEPGVQSSAFGPAVGRPVIRGLEGARVQVLQGGVGSLDVSTISADHAVTIEPFLAEQIEVLKGPATLLYGSGAIGGVVNVVDGRIAEHPIDGFEGRAELHGNSANDERAGMLRFDHGNGAFVLHGDYVRRDGDDFDLPDDATLRNSGFDQDSRALGFAWTGDAGYAGVALSRYDNAYGIPLGSSAEAPVPGADPEETVVLDMQQDRIDARAGWYAPFTGIDKLALRAARNDYEHVERVDGDVGTRFTSDAAEIRIEAVHAALAGWTGAFGVQLGKRDFAAIGAEAFVPPTETDERGVFLVEQREFAPFKLELGVRLDDIDNGTATGLASSFSPLSLSAGAIWEASEAWHVSLNLDRAERAPAAEELYSNGPHEATAGFEIGDPALAEERANQAEIGLHFHTGRFEGELSAYVNRFDDFIYLVDTGEVDPDEGLPIRAWTQDDADFRGVEGKLEARLADNPAGRWALRVFGDLVEGELDDGTPLPRITPARLGASLAWERDVWRASLGATRVFGQDDVAPLESPTDGYTLVDAHVSYAFAAGDVEGELFVDATNLTDQDAFVHNSLLKDRAPLPGRGVQFGARLFW